MNIESRMKGQHVLIVEDEFFIAMDTQLALEQMGAIIVGPASNVADALGLIASRTVDCAILDIRLDVDDSYPIADKLMERHIPFLFASSESRGALPERFSGYVLIDKPLEMRLIVDALLGPPH
ncbi:response regulator [Rhizobium sp. TRM95796]|uniref:response regulator n=1 Tax=Rhizobium sp. TRM95796 TaxID=2979862 RepID=UPI0021E8C3E0|nr:response regulator [Rhizobium sp. TRM95796]MCV3768671.1 response regulator [Rhizobium sp. TRM95796]